MIRSSLIFLFATSSFSIAEETYTFERDIRPLFREYCFDCHGATDELKGGLDLRLVRFMKAGGESGPAIHPGESTGKLSP